MRSRLSMIFLFMAAWLFAAPNVPAEVLRLYSVPIVNQGHFIETLLQDFAHTHGVTLEVTSVEGRAVMRAAREGKADLVIAHADFKGTNKLRHDGVLGPARRVFENPIALLSPTDDPAHTANATSLEQALAAIERSKSCLVENNLEHLREFNPKRSNLVTCYLNVGGSSGLEAVLLAARKHAYVWWGLHPFLMNDISLKPILIPDPRILRPLHAWPVTGANQTLAGAAIDFLLAPATQAAIAKFRLPNHADIQPWWPAAAVERSVLIKARSKVLVATKNDRSRANGEHRDPAHRQKRNFELKIAQAIATELLGPDGKIEPVILRKPQRIPAVASEQVDFGIAMFEPTEKAREEVDFSQPYFEDGIALMQRAGEEPPTGNQLSKLRLLTLARDSLGVEVDKQRLDALAGTPITTREVPDFATGAAEISAHKADGLVSLAVNIDAYLAHEKGLIRSPMLSQIQFAIAVPKLNPQLLASINKVLSELKSSGKLQRWSKELR